MSGFLDDRLTDPERRSVALHLEVCEACSSERERTARLRAAMRSMPVAYPPARLETDLQILASKEIVRARRMGSVSAFTRDWMDRVRLLVDNLMKPLALPFAGGLTSALFMFVMLLPSIDFLRNTTHDTPSTLYTEASIDKIDEFAPRGKANDDTVVEVQIDGQGHMVDYNVLEGTMTGEVGNLLLFATFTPATVFLQPTSGKIVIRHSHIVVKG